MRRKRLALLEDLVAEVDYDIYKELFVMPEYPEDAENAIEPMLKLIEDYEKEVIKNYVDKECSAMKDKTNE